MALSADLISQFVKTTKDTTTASTSTLVYGTVKIVGDTAYVMVDGSEQLVPINSTATISDGNRVTMTIENHTATVTGNLTDVSASSAMVGILSDQVDSLVSIVDSMVEIDSSQIEIMQSDIEILKAHVQLEDSDIIITDSYLKSIESSIEALNSVIQITDAGVVISGTNLTIEGSDITVSGLDVDAVNSTVELVNSYLKVEDNVLYINGIEAGWIDVGSLSADVANINTLLAGSAGVTTLQSIHITSENVVFQDAVIDDAAINTLSASKLTAGIIYTNFITLQSDVDDMGLYITKSLIAMYDSNDIQRLQAGMSSEEEGYNFVIWDSDGTQLFNATGITASGIPSETIVNDHVSNNAAISGEKLDITSVVNSINEDGNVQVDYSNVKIDNTTLSAVYTTLIEAADFTQALQTEFTVENGEITASLWETTFNDAINVINDTFTTLYADLDGITASVGKLTSTLDYTGYTYRNYALLSGNYTEGGETGFYLSSDDASNYYTITVHDGYIRIECIADTTTNYLVFLDLSEDTPEYGTYTLSFKERSSKTATLGVGIYATTESFITTYNNYLLTVNTSTWTTQSTTGTFLESDANPWNVLSFSLANFNSAGDYIDITDVMFEESDEAHDWEAAPEDYGMAITALYNQLSTLTITMNSITATVDEAYVTAESALDLCSNLELTVNGLNSTVSTVFNLSYRNYALLSGNFTEGGEHGFARTIPSSSESSYYSVTAYDGYVRCLCKTATSNTHRLYQKTSDTFEELMGGTFNIIVKIRASKASSITLAIGRKTSISASSITISSIDAIAADELTAGEWVTITKTVELSSSYYWTKLYFSLANFNSADDYIDIAYIIIQDSDSEETEWVPAPEDYGFTELVFNQSTMIQQLSDSIALCATKDELTTQMELIAGQFDLYVTNEVYSSEITALSDSISLAVMSDGSSGALYLGNGTNGNIVFTVDSEYLKISEDGIISATNGEFSGTVTTTGTRSDNKTNKTILDSGALSVYIDDTICGRVDSGIWDSTNGIGIIAYNSGYVALGYNSGSTNYISFYLDGSTGYVHSDNRLVFNSGMYLNGSTSTAAEDSTNTIYGIYCSGYFSTNGRLLVGNTDYGTKVSVTGSITLTGGIYNPNASGGVIYNSNGNFRPVDDDFSYCGTSEGRWMRVYATNSSIGTSDINEKTNIVEIDERYEELFMLLEPVNYMWKNFKETDNHDRIHCGLIAQQVESACSEVGLDSTSFAALCRDDLETPTIDGRTERYGMAYAELHGLEIHMIQKCLTTIADLQTQIETLTEMLQNYI